MEILFLPTHCCLCKNLLKSYLLQLYIRLKTQIWTQLSVICNREAKSDQFMSQELWETNKMLVWTNVMSCHFTIYKSFTGLGR